MSSRERILAALRAQSIAPVPLPALDGAFIRYPDLEAQLCLALELAKANVVRLEPGAELAATLRGLDVVRRARSVCSLVPQFEATPPPRDASACADLDVTLFEAEFGVAENGALWVQEPVEAPRAALFLAQHIVGVVSRRELVHNMHEAYARLGARFGRYGCFMSGPSKTADIEQALVIGAHGARSMTVVLT